MIGDKSVGTIVSKLEKSRAGRQRGYIAMLAVDPAYRGRKIGSALVKMSVARMTSMGADEVRPVSSLVAWLLFVSLIARLIYSFGTLQIVLETEMTNAASISLYEKLGFSRTKLLRRYYMNGNDAYRLKLFITEPHTNVLV